VTFFWSGPAGFQAYEPNTSVSVPGVYTLLVTNPANGCISTADAVVTQDITSPVVTANGGVITCSNPSTTLTAIANPTAAVYSWTGPGGYSSNAQNPTATQAGIYIVVATDIMNGCTASATAAVTPDGSFSTASAVVTNVLCNGGNNGAITLTVSGGTSPYTFSWTGPNSFASTTQNPTNLSAGQYAVTVTDIVGCSAVTNITIAQPTVIQVAPGIGLLTVTCFGQSDGFINLPTPTGGTPPYTYSWSNGATTLPIGNLSAGLYALTVTDANGCTRAFQYLMNSPSAPLAITNSIICDETISVNAAGGTLPYIYTWSTGSTTQSITGLTPGEYTVTIYDNNGCSVSQSVSFSANAVSCTKITGKIGLDENLNCLSDSAEATLKFWFVQAVGLNGTYYGVSDIDGTYTISLLPGDYTVSLVSNNLKAVICQNDLPVTLAQSGDTETADFLVQISNSGCPQLSVDLTVSVLRRCFSNNYYYVQYCNNGTANISGAYVTLELDPFLIPLQAYIPYSTLANNVLRFELGTVPAGFCGNFWVRMQVSCDAVLGQIHCSEARIYPDSICDPVNPLWSGAQVEVNSECLGDSLHFILKNTGTGDMSEELEYIVIEDGIMLRSGMAPALPAGGEMTVKVPANGATWRVEAQQEAFSPRPDQPVLSVEGCSSTGSFSTGFVSQFSLGDESPWTDINCTANVGSYDPNDKQGFPIGYGPSHYVRPGTELEYLIRFQNTGTDTAFTVIIRDTLAAELDPLTVRPGASSHDYRFELAGEGILIFDFQNILLPDSNVNEPASHGFVQFRISPRANVPLETNILNRAAIYFDFNDPIITNTTQHRIGENFLTVGLWQPQRPEYAVQVAPHPLAEASWITIPGAPETGDYRLRVFDLAGRSVREMAADTPQFLLRKDSLSAGMYMFRVECDGVLVGSGKLAVQ
jgi:uncharacterized repeat protein (TIGR01451 family)